MPQPSTRSPQAIIRSWCLYDWANSAYSLTIVSSIFPIYWESVTTQPDGSRLVQLGPFSVLNTALFSYCLSAAFLLVAVLSPLLAGMADVGSYKRGFLRFFCLLGSVACASLFFFTADTLWLGMLAFVLATVGFASSLVFYNAYLPVVAPATRIDAVSARGFAYGYVGSVLLLVLNLLPLLQPAWFGGVGAGLASRFAFLSVGLWWAGFGLWAIAGLPSQPGQPPAGYAWLRRGYAALVQVWHQARANQPLGRYLLSFFFFNMAVQTVMYLAALFGSVEIKLDGSSLIITILLLQLVAIPGAWATARLSQRWGNRQALLAVLLVWVGICIGAYFTTTSTQFFALAAVVGLVMGGVQALSRATYAKLLPPHTSDTASFFSFYDVAEKLSIVLGTALYGLVETLTGSMRNSTLGLVFLFAVGIGLLLRVRSSALAPAAHVAG